MAEEDSRETPENLARLEKAQALHDEWIARLVKECDPATAALCVAMLLAHLCAISGGGKVAFEQTVTTARKLLVEAEERYAASEE